MISVLNIVVGCAVNSTGIIGWLVNGIALHGWSDGLSHNGVDVWHSLAFEFSKFDFDICLGKADDDNAYHRKISNTLKFIVFT